MVTTKTLRVKKRGQSKNVVVVVYIYLSVTVSGAYLGGALGHGPPLGRQDSIISIE